MKRALLAVVRKDDPRRRTVASMKSSSRGADAYGFSAFISKSDIEVQVAFS
jgi:hypothetical protein